MSLSIGRLVLDDPESFPEAVGESVSRVGATPVPGGRTGLTTSADLESFVPGVNGGSAASRRQMRAILNNLPYRLTAPYIAWTEDPELDGWYVPGKATFDVAGSGALVSNWWKFSGLELALVGRPRTHRRGVAATLRDRRLATTPRDYLRRVYSTAFNGMTATALTWLPSAISDPTLTAVAALQMTSIARTGQGGSFLQALVGAADLSVITFEQSVAVRNVGDVVVRDRRGVLTAPTAGAASEWEEVYGPDWPLLAGDVPVLENSLVRVRWDSTNTPGFALDRWIAGAWAEQAKVIIRREGDSSGFDDTLVRADVLEWTPDRAVVRAILRRAADTYSREEVYLTLQRGWTGPRVEVYAPAKSTGATAGATIMIFRAAAPSGTDTAEKFDATLQTATGSANFTDGAAVGAATFTGENWIGMRRTGVAAIGLAVLQVLTAAVRSSTSAYGTLRNGLSVGITSGGYAGAHVGMNDRSDATAREATVGTTFDGHRDLGREVLYDSRSPQVIVPR